MQHLRFAGGLTCMEVDHFDPRKKIDAVQDYNNLFLASRHCNRSKDKFWPTAEEAADGMRLLNPCEEMDYGVHIFEDPATGELVGATPPGWTHIEICDLNAGHLVEERRLRAGIRARLTEVKARPASAEDSLLSELLSKVDEAEAFMIPPIPPPPLRD